MFATASNRLDWQIVQCFRNSPACSAEELQEGVSAARSDIRRRASLRAVYKSLNRLLSLGVLVKRGKNYSLRLTWILNVMSEAESLYSALTADPSAAALLPPPGERGTWNFTSLTRLDSFWVELMLALFKGSDEKIMFQYVPHAWFSLVHPEVELHTAKAMVRSKNRLYTILGSDTYLDRQNVALWPADSFSTSFAESPFDYLQNTSFNVCGDFVLTITLDAKISGEIDSMFSAVKKKGDAEAGKILRTLHAPCRAKLTLENNPKKAQRLAGSCRRFWGL